MAEVDRLPHAAAVEADEGAEWIRRHWVSLTAAAALALQLWWKAGLLAHFFFAQGDYPLIDRAAGARLSLGYVLAPVGGQLAPGVRALAWAETRLALYSWTLAGAITLLLLAAAGLLLLRMLRTIFGDRPAILIPFALYLFTPLTMPGFAWWSSALSWLPLHLAIFGAVDAHVRWTRTGNRGQLAAAACWLLAGMMFSEKGALVPLLLLALTGLLAPGGSRRLAVRSGRAAWLVYGLLTAAFVALTVTRLSGSGGHPDVVKSPGAVLGLVSSMAGTALIPGALGGPWRWQSVGDYALAARVPVLTQLSWVLAGAVVLASLWTRWRAWRAWAILAGWLAVADVLPVLLGRSGVTVTAALGANLSYLADVVPVLVLCVGLAFLPVAGETAAYHARLPATQTRYLLAANVLVVVVAGALWSGHAYEQAASGAAARSYIATAREALARARPGAVIVSAPAPAAVINPAFFGSASFTRAVLGPLAAPRRVRWIASASGLETPVIFDAEGRLWPAAVAGVSGGAPPGKSGCWRAAPAPARIPLAHVLYQWSWTIQFSYRGPAATLLVGFGGAWRAVSVPAGGHQVFVPVHSQGGSVTVAIPQPRPRACVSQLTVGTMQPWLLGVPVPAVPAAG
jgi:hypothetical protein